tara:strand:- start:4647 stop:5546 length:900 start_codon:yes stop_codon:yes gene_type:complete
MANIGSGGKANTSTMFNSFVPEVWTQGVRYYFQKNLILAGLATDWSDAVTGGGDTVHIPRINEQSSAAKTQGSAITWSHNTTDESEDVLSINNHHYSGLLVEDIGRVQASDDLMAKYTMELGYALAKKIEITVEAGMESAADNSIELTKSSTSGKIGLADLGTMIKTLAENDIDYLDGNTYLVLSPTSYSSLFELDDFARADVIGDSFNFPRVSGFIGKLGGIPVFLSNVVGTAAATTFGYLFHKSFSNLAFSQKPRMQDQYDIDYLGTKVVTDAVYGWLGKDENAASKRRCWKLLDAS